MKKLISLIVRLINVLKSYRLYLNLKKSWGIRDVYHISSNELKILIRARAKIIFLNKDGGDGTFTHRVKFLDHEFMQSTTEEISLE